MDETHLEAWAERAPTAIALRHKVLDVWVARTWAELRDEVAALAAGLASLGFAAGDRLAIVTDVRPEPLLITLAAHCLGGSVIVGGRSGARFVFVQDGAHARGWPEHESNSVLFLYLDPRGAAADAISYRWLCEHGRAWASGGGEYKTVHQTAAAERGADEVAHADAHGVRSELDPCEGEPSIFVAGAVSKRYALAQLMAAAAANASRVQLSSDHDAFAPRLSLEAQITTVLPLWLHTGLRLSFAEHAATTADADRRELGPSLLISPVEEIEQLRRRVVESAPPGFDLRRPMLLRARARAAIRDALGWGQLDLALIAGQLTPAAADFCAAVGVEVQTLEAPASEPARSEPPVSRPLLPAATPAAVTTLEPRAREAFLRLDHISLAFNEVKAVSDISFEVSRHEICALIGPNGAGKSSLLNVINGIYRPNSGTIFFDGAARSEMTPRGAARVGIARTFQNLAIFKGMTVLENIMVGRTLSVRSSWIEQALWLGRARESEDRSRQRAEEVLEFLRLQRYRHVPAAQLPYGLQKRVELGRAIAADPRLLLLDEPMAGMNADEKADMSEIILDVNRELGTTVVLIEHDMRVVMDISDHVVVLDYGRLVGDGTPAEVRQNPDVLRAYLGRKRVA